MIQRCGNEKRPAYQYYGAQGISVDPEWSDFTVFLRDMGERPSGTTLDRKDGKRGYCKENCKWSTPKEQNNNRPGYNVTITAFGQSLTVAQWADLTGLHQEAIRSRRRKGETPEQILRPKRPYKRRLAV